MIYFIRYHYKNEHFWISYLLTRYLFIISYTQYLQPKKVTYFYNSRWIYQWIRTSHLDTKSVSVYGCIENCCNRIQVVHRTKIQLKQVLCIHEKRTDRNYCVQNRWLIECVISNFTQIWIIAKIDWYQIFTSWKSERKYFSDKRWYFNFLNITVNENNWIKNVFVFFCRLSNQ